MTLSEATLTGALLDPAQPVPEGLTDGQGRPAGRRLNVYRNNIASSLTEALERNFPAIARLIGAENFRHISGLFLRAHPPQSPLIALYGAEFAAFLETFQPLAKYPYLGDIARVEQARRAAYHAADATPLDPATLATLSPEALMQARLTLAPAVHLVQSRFPVHAIWAFNMEDGPKPRPTAQSVLVTRPGFDPVLTPLSPAAGNAIAALMAGEPLGTAHDHGLASDPGFDLAEALTPLIAQQAVTALTP
jgi:hypothetical protein